MEEERAVQEQTSSVWNFDIFKGISFEKSDNFITHLILLKEGATSAFMLTLPAIIMSAFRVGSTEPRSPRRQRARRNAMGDVTVGISADQLHSLEAMVQTYMPDFFNPAAASSTGDERSQQRRNAVGNLFEELSSSDLQHLEEMVQTHQPSIGNTVHRHHSSYDEDSSSGDGEEACSSASATGPDPVYCSRRRNALANALADLDDETLRTLQSLHHCSRNGYSAGVWNVDNRRIWTIFWNWICKLSLVRPRWKQKPNNELKGILRL